jgi:ABC-type enterochelin transport system permease subunit
MELNQSDTDFETSSKNVVSEIEKKIESTKDHRKIIQALIAISLIFTFSMYLIVKNNFKKETELI